MDKTTTPTDNKPSEFEKWVIEKMQHFESITRTDYGEGAYDQIMNVKEQYDFHKMNLSQQLPTPTEGEKEGDGLQMELEFQNNGDKIVLICPDEDGDFCIRMKNKGARHWMVYGFEANEAKEMAAFLNRHVDNLEVEDNPAPPIEQKTEIAKDKEDLPPCGCTSGEDCNGDCIIPKWLAIKLLAIRDQMVKGDHDEAWHILYSIASPDFDKYSHDVWRGIEDFAGVPFPTPTPAPQKTEEKPEDEKLDTCVCSWEGEGSQGCTYPKCDRIKEAASPVPDGAEGVPEEIMQFINAKCDELTDAFRKRIGVKETDAYAYLYGARDAAISCYQETRDTIASLTQEREQLGAEIIHWTLRLEEAIKERDTARNALQKMIDDLKAKSDEAEEYRKALETVRDDPNKHRAVGKFIDTALAKYPNP